MKAGKDIEEIMEQYRDFERTRASAQEVPENTARKGMESCQPSVEGQRTTEVLPPLCPSKMRCWG